MHRPSPAEGNDLEELLGEEPVLKLQVPAPNSPIWPDDKAAAFCALTPPLETFMVIPDEIRKEHFYHSARQDDVLIGVVSAIQDSGLIITLLSYDQGPRRDLGGLKLTGFCPTRQLPRNTTQGNILDHFPIGCKIRAFILDVHHSGRLILSMNQTALNVDLHGDLKLGKITDDELPLHFKKLQNLDGKSFETCLESTPQFRNPDGLRILCSRLGIPRASTCSLLLSVAKINLPKPEMACELRRLQLYNLSMKHVAQGVKYFKDGRNTESLQCYNFALEVEKTNADAFVARGALYASIGTYSKALDDLEKSLLLQPNHANAKNYLGQTLLAYAFELSAKEPVKAEQLLKRALTLDPNNEEAREALRGLPSSGGRTMDNNLRSWSRTPSPKRNTGFPGHNFQPVSRQGRPPMSPKGRQLSDGNQAVMHSERGRASVDHSAELDRTNRMLKDPNRIMERDRNSDFSKSRMYMDDKPRGEVRAFDGAGAGGEKGDFAKIVITRNRSGRTIRCEDSGRWREGGREVNRRDDWKNTTDRELTQARREVSETRQIPQSQYQYDRRVFTPPKDAKEVENGVLTHYTNESDLPMTSKTLQARVQQRLKDIERRHGVEANFTIVADGKDISQTNTSPSGGPGSNSQSGYASWRGRNVPMSSDMDRRGGDERRGAQFRSEFHRGSGNFYAGRGRARGGPRWRGQWDDWRGGRRGGAGNWHNRDNRFGDRREPVSYEDRRRRRSHHSASGGGGATGDRSATRSKSRSRFNTRSRSASRSRSKSRSASHSARSYSRSVSRSPSPFPKKKISRARVRTPPLAPLTNRQSDSEEHMADVEQFIAQLKAKRQKQQELQVQSSSEATIGPQMPTSIENSAIASAANALD